MKISPADLSELLAALVPGRIHSSLVLQYTSPMRGGGGMEIAKVIRILQKKVPQQLTAVVHLAQLHAEDFTLICLSYSDCLQFLTVTLTSLE